MKRVVAKACIAFCISTSLGVTLTFAVNPPAPFLPSDKVTDPNCLPTDSNCYVSVSSLSFTNATVTNLVSTNSTSSSLFSTLLQGLTAFFTNLVSINSTTTNGTITNAAITNSTTNNATTTNFYSGNIVANNSSSTNATSTNLFTQGLQAVVGTITNLLTTTITTTNASTTNLSISGALYDGSNTTGSNGMILQTTGTSTKWVATSSLGISGGSGAAFSTTSINGLATTTFSFSKTDDTNLSLVISTTTSGVNYALAWLGTLSSSRIASSSEWSQAYASTSALTPGYFRALLSNTVTGLTYNSGTGATALTGGYVIPLIASTTEWQAAYASTSALTPAYTRGLFSNSVLGLTYNSSTGGTSLTAGYSIPLTASSSNWDSFYDTPSSRITAGPNCTWTGNSLNCTSAGGATTTINGAIGPNFTFNTGSSGSDFTIATSAGTVTFSIPDASASARGLLTSGDWINFTNKVSNTYASTTFPSFTYASSTYYFASNPAGYITSSALTPYVQYSYASSTFPSFAYASSTYYPATNPSGYVNNTVSNLTNYPTYAYASSTYASTSYIASNYVPYSYASSTYVDVVSNQVVTGNKTFTGGTTFGNATTTNGFFTNLVANVLNVIGQLTFTTASGTGITATNVYGNLYPTGVTNTLLATDMNGRIVATTTPAGIAGGTNGYLARWTGGSTLSIGTLIDNAVVSGVNATSATTNFLVQGTGALNPFQVSSSSGSSLFGVNVFGRLTVGTNSGNTNLFINGGSASQPLPDARSIAIGQDSYKYVNLSGPLDNTALGFQAMSGSSTASITGFSNVAIGNYSLKNLTTGNSVVAVGTNAASAITDENDVVALGANAIRNALGPADTTAIGASAGRNILGGIGLNTMLGRRAMMGSSTAVASTITPSVNTAIGIQSMVDIVNGYENVGVGYESVAGVTNGIRNIGVGNNALHNVNNGSNNTAVGHGSLDKITTSNNVAVGLFAGSDDNASNLRSIVDDYVTFLGFRASRDQTISSTTPLTNIAAIGANARVARSNSIILGGTSTYAVNVGIGTTTPDASLTIRGNGSDNAMNVASSSGATLFTILANGNVGIGASSPGYLLHVGSASVSGVVSRFQNSTGYCDINPTTTSLTCTSDIRLKKNINPITETIAKLTQLNPVTYNWLSENGTSSPHAGFIAQEVQPLFPDLVATDDKGTLSVAYTGFIPYLVDSVKSLALSLKNLTDKVASFSNSIESNTLCLTENGNKTCISKSQLDSLLQRNGVSPSANLPSSDPQTASEVQGSSSTLPYTESPSAQSDESSSTTEVSPQTTVSSSSSDTMNTTNETTSQ